jgi:hypothetical protein
MKVDRQFAVTRCWSRGDSNRRSSLWFLALTKGSKFRRGRCAKADQRIVSRSDLLANSGGKLPDFDPFPKWKRPKRTGGSNPLRSSNESLLTAVLGSCGSLDRREKCRHRLANRDFRVLRARQRRSLPLSAPLATRRALPAETGRNLAEKRLSIYRTSRYRRVKVEIPVYKP